MNITAGLMDHIVLQRNNRDLSETRLEGTTAADGQLRITVTKNAKALAGFSNKVIGRSKRKHFALTLTGIPVGGSYDAILSVTSAAGEVLDQITVHDILVGDVWMLGGQSNMQGCALLDGSPRALPRVRAFYMGDRWAAAQEPLHDMWNTVDDVHVTLSGGRPTVNTTSGAGPGASFAQTIFKATAVPQGVIASAHGGTTMAQWNPALKKQGSNSLYGAMMRRFRKNGSHIAGVIWYQGESESNQDASRLFTRVMKSFIRDLRHDMHSPSLPFISVQISRIVGTSTPDSLFWNSVQDQQRTLALSVPHYAVVPAVDLPLVDPVHISTEGYAILGRRLAEAALTLTGKIPKPLPPPLALKSVTATDGQLGSAGCIEVAFDNVVGTLKASGRPSGFSVIDHNGIDQAYRIRLVGNKAIIDTALGANALKKTRVRYGHGFNPHCNIEDEAGRAVPVFGPIHLATPRPATGLVQFYHVTRLLPSAGKLNKLTCPKNLSQLGLQPKHTISNFCRLHEAFAAVAPTDVHVFYAWKIHCSEAMKLGVSLGYDGPVKVWVNRRMIFHDPDGTNPSSPDQRVAPFRANKGDNDLIIALGSNFGAAWGLFIGLERMDVPKAEALRQPPSFAMPEFRPYA